MKVSNAATIGVSLMVASAIANADVRTNNRYLKGKKKGKKSWTGQHGKGGKGKGGKSKIGKGGKSSHGKGGKSKNGNGGKGKSKGDEKCYPKDYVCPKHSMYAQPAHVFGGHVVIANRAEGTISLVDPETLMPAITYELPDDGEPMYFAFIQHKSEIWVGDRANDRLVILRMVGCDLVYDGYLPTCAGTFHSMSTQDSTEKYKVALTTCDGAGISIAYDMTTRRKIGVLEIPDEVAEAGAVPHDVTLNGPYAFVTYLSQAEGGGDGYVASYDTADGELLSVLKTEHDPHVAVRDDSNLHISARGVGIVYTALVPYLNVTNTITTQPSPHGMFLSYSGEYLYTTNIAEGGTNAVAVLDPETGEEAGCPQVNTTYPIPHNPALSRDGKRLYITHSGPTSDVNSVFTVGDDGCLDPDSEKTFETGLNPFGLFVLPEAVDLLQCVNQV